MSKPIVIERTVIDQGVNKRYHFYWCYGCDSLHFVAINPDKNTIGAGWDFSGTLENPIYSPSQLIRYEYGPAEERKTHICHTFIKDGMIQYLGDCTHEFRNQTIPMSPLPDWFLKQSEKTAEN